MSSKKVAVGHARLCTPPANSSFTVESSETRNPAPATRSCGGKPKCADEYKVYLSLRAYPVVARQVGDIVNWYSKITNLTDKLVDGPIDFYISGSVDPIAFIDYLPAGGFYNLLVSETVDELDIANKFIVATVWARLRETGCLLGNVVESEVAVDDSLNTDNTLQFANPTLFINATETSLDVQVGVDIINLSSLAVDSLAIDLGVIFGKDTELSYLVDGLPSTIFDVADGVLSLAEGEIIGAGQRISLLVTNTDKTINLDGFCSQSCQSTASWRFVGESTNSTGLNWVGTSEATTATGFSAVKSGSAIQLPTGPTILGGWVSQPQGADPLYKGTFNDGGFDDSAGMYTVPTSGRYLLSASISTSYNVPANTVDTSKFFDIIADGITVVTAMGPTKIMVYTPLNVITSTTEQGSMTVNLSRVVYLDGGAKVALRSTIPSSVFRIGYFSTSDALTTFDAVFLGA